MHTMLNLYRRHASDCKHKAKGRAWRNCSCPVWAQGTLAGRPIKQSLDTRDWKRGQDIIHQWEIAQRADSTVTVVKACAEFVADLEARHMSSSTIKNYGKMLTSTRCKSLCAVAGNRHMREIDVQFLTEWRATWTDAPITQQKKLERLRAFFRWCEARGYCNGNPAVAIKPPKVRQKPTLPFTAEEIARLLLEAPKQGTPEEGQRLKAYILVCLHTGLRRGDAATLACDALRGNRLLLRQEKTGEPLYTLLPQSVIDELAGVRKLSARHWFWTGSGAVDTVGNNFARSFRRLCAKCNVEGGHLHRLRDTFAVTALNAGVPIEVVSKLLGHASIRVTEKHYSPWVRSRQEQLEAALARMWGQNQPVQNWNKEESEERIH